MVGISHAIQKYHLLDEGQEGQNQRTREISFHHVL